MKKLFKWILIPAMILSLAGTVFAADNILRVRDATAKKGETVYLTVELTEQVLGDTIGISYTYDDAYLTPVVDSCSWVKNGTIQNFDLKGGKGVWSVGEQTDLSGGVCVLAFSVNERAEFTGTTVSCTLIVKNNRNTVGTYTAEGKIIPDCEHTYGDWVDSGELGHIQTCSACQGTHIESHQWGDATVVKGQNGENTAYYTCQVCGGTKTELTDEDENLPTTPESNKPTVTNPTQQEDDDHHDHSDYTTENSNGGNTQSTGTNGLPGGDADNKHEDHTHAGAENNGTQTTDPHAGHNHSNEGGADNSWIAVVVLFGGLTAIFGVTAYIVKKRK